MRSIEARRSDSWIWLLILFTAAGFCEAMVYGQLGAFMPLYLPQLGVPPQDVPLWTGVVAALTSAVGIIFLPFWGALADRYSRQPIIVRSFVMEFLAVIVMMLANNIWAFILGRSLTALALGNTGLMLTTLSERAPRRRLGVAFSIMSSAPPVAAFLGPLLGGPIVDARGFQTLMFIDAAVLVVVILAMSFGYKDNYHGTERGPLLSMAAESVRIIVRSSRLRTLFAALFLLLAGWTLCMTYLPLVVTSLYSGDQPGTAVGVITGAGGIAALLLSPLMGVAADRRGHWRVLSAGAVVLVPLWLAPLFVQGLAGFGVAWAIINGVASSVFALSFILLSTSAASDVRGRVMSFAFLPFNVSYMIGPGIGSIVTSISLFAIFPTAAVLTALGLAVLRVAHRQPVSEPEATAA